MDELSSYRISIVQPASEFQSADLIVEGEEGDVNGTSRSELCRRRPKDVAGTLDNGQTSHVLPRIIIGAKKKRKNSKYDFEIMSRENPIKTSFYRLLFARAREKRESFVRGRKQRARTFPGKYPCRAPSPAVMVIGCIGR